jgi:hypothetical protein
VASTFFDGPAAFSVTPVEQLKRQDLESGLHVNANVSGGRASGARVGSQAEQVKRAFHAEKQEHG